MSTVFSHIIQKRFSGVNEDVATDALAYILESSVAARRGMQNLLAGCTPDMPELTFKTQQQEGSIRPDMWGFAGSAPHVYIENKFWAGLTDNQPVSYLRALSKCGSPSVLLVIAPEKRQHTLWRELCARLQAAGVSVREGDPKSGILQVAVTSEGPVIALSSWGCVLTALEMQSVDDPAARGDIAQLRALCEAADSEAFLPLSAETLCDQRTPQLMLQLSDLVQAIADAAVARGVFFHGGLRPQNSSERIGRYTYFGEDRRSWGWVGVHFRHWRTYGRTPLWFVISQPECDRKGVADSIGQWAAKNGVFTARDAKGDFVIALDIQAGEEKGAVVSAIVDKLEAAYQQLPILHQSSVIEPALPETPDE